MEFGGLHRSFPEASEVRSVLWDTMPGDPLCEQVGADGGGGCGICQEVVQVCEVILRSPEVCPVVRMDLLGGLFGR